MSASQERLADLVALGRQQRLALVDHVTGVRNELEARRTQLRVAGWLATGLAAAITASFKLFGKRSLAAKVGRYSSTASLLLGLVRGALRLRSFFF
jgi:hypothetical protein